MIASINQPFARLAWLWPLLVSCSSGELPHEHAAAEPVTHEPARPAAATTATPQRPLVPRVSMPTGHVVLGPAGKLPLRLQGVPSARLRVVPISAADFEHVAKYAGFHPASEDPLKAAGRDFLARAVTRIVAADDPHTETLTELDPFVAAGGSKTQLLFAVLDAPGAQARSVVIQRGNLASVLKLGRENGLVWVARTSDGKPEPGARVTVSQGGVVRFTGATDKSGLLMLPARDRLLLPSAHKGAEHPILVRAESPSGLAFHTEHWNTGLSPWSFELPEAYWEGPASIRGVVTAERGIFRPGESVNLLGVLRQRGRAGQLSVPSGKFKLSVHDPDGTLITSKQLPLTQFGTLRSELKLPSSARLGTYRISLGSGAGQLSSSFEVGKYRAARFEVKLGTSFEESESGQLLVPISASYLWGAPLKGGKVSFSASTRPRRHLSQSGFRFDNSAEGTHDGNQVTGELLLDQHGNGKLTLDRELLGGESVSQARDLVLEAEVTDPGGDVITARSAVPGRAAPALVGLLTKNWVVDPSQGWTVELIAEDAAGKRKPGQIIELELTRRYFRSYTENTDYGTRYAGDWETEIIEKREVTSAAAPTSAHFALKQGGSYSLRARIKGQTAYAETDVWAYGEGASAAMDNDPRMSIRADRDAYAPGDTAKLFIGSPYANSTALVSLERAGVMSAYVTQLKGAEQPISVKLEEQHLPNLFVSVATLPHGLDRGSPASGIPLRVGYTSLSVSPEQRRLSVRITPSQPEYQPGQTAEVNVSVKDHTGKPVSAEVTLWAADEGVLMLTGYQTPDPFAPAYAPHPIDITTSTSLVNFVSPDPYRWDSTGGDSAPAEGSAFRSRFLGTAFFSKQAVVTGASGEARVKLELPDNLTRWRVMAAVADPGQRFGRAESSFTTKKPLQVVPALPRFLTSGDSTELTFLVQDSGGSARKAKLSLTLDTLAPAGSRKAPKSKASAPAAPPSAASLDGPAQLEFDLAAGGQHTAKFRIRAANPGQLRIRARVNAGADTDAVELSLPVEPRHPYTRRLIGDGRLEKEASLSIAVPASAEPGVGSVELNLSASVLASLGGGIDSLLEYPHGCVEQTTSRLIPLVMLEDLMRRSGDSRLSGAAHRKRMDAAIAHVLDHQNTDGGFGLWPESSSEGFLTAYALWGLGTAKQHGYAVPPASVERGFNYLAQHVEDGDDMHGQFSSLETKPFAAFVLGQAERDDKGLGARLAQAKGLSRFATGLLGSALTKQPSAAGLLASLKAAEQPLAQGGRIVPELDGGDTFAYGKDLRSTAIAIRSLLGTPRQADADLLVQGVLAQRRPDGSWGTTYNNLWALYALGAYAKQAEPGGPSRVDVYLGARLLKSVSLSAQQPTDRVVLTGAELPKPGSQLALRLVPKGGTARYSAQLRYVDASLGKSAQEHGLSVTRSLLDPDTGAPVKQVKRGQLLRVSLVVSSPERRAQIAVMDRLPAGFEAVDTGLVTSASDTGTDSSAGAWVWRELHDERVTFFADWLPAGSHRAEFLVRATSSGRFIRPPAVAEGMYDPELWAHSTAEIQVVE